MLIFYQNFFLRFFTPAAGFRRFNVQFYIFLTETPVVYPFLSRNCEKILRGDPGELSKVASPKYQKCDIWTLMCLNIAVM